MNKESFEFLIKDEVQSLIEANLNSNPQEFALRQKYNGPHSGIVPTQLKNLQKSKKKIPSFFNARCIIPTRAYEQCSSEKTAQMRHYTGKTCLDLTCGLGVDTYTYTRKFDSVTSLELNPVYCDIAEYNFRKLGVNNVKVINSSAEDFIENYSGPSFDLIYADPSRRDQTGKRLNALEEFSPSIPEILPKLKTISSRILFKLSPLFDLSEAKRVFPEAKKIVIISVDNECKELLIEFENHQELSEQPFFLNLMLNKRNREKSFVFFETMQKSSDFSFPEQPNFILEPDVAFYKGRVTQRLFDEYFSELNGRMNDGRGFFFTEDLPEAMDFPGRVFKIEESLFYKPKQLKKRLKALKIKRIQITQRNFPFSVKDIRKQLNIDDGGEFRLICTTIGLEKRVFLVSEVRKMVNTR